MPRRARITHVLRLAVLSVVAVSTAAAATAGAAASPPPSPWLQTGYNAASSNANLAESSLNRAGLRTLQPKLTVSGNASAENCSEGPEAPALSESRLYAMVDGALEAYQVGSHQLLWRRVIDPVDQSIFRDIAVSHGLVIVASYDCFTNDPVTSIDAFASATGAPAWHRSWDDALENMAVTGKFLVAQTGCFYCDQTTHVLRVQTGAPVWHRSGTGSTRGGVIFQPGVVVGGLSFLAREMPGGRYRLTAYRVGDGKAMWTRRGRFLALAGDSAVAGARVLLLQNQATGVISVADPATGADRFPLRGLAGYTGQFAVTSRRVVGSCGSSTCAFDATNGRREWHTGNPSGGEDGLFLANGLVYLSDGRVLAAATGAPAGRVPGSPMMVGSGRLLVDSDAAFTVYQPR
jgi:outer membrane protein assembly factor BamB